jgi:hypothetical protein
VKHTPKSSIKTDLKQEKISSLGISEKQSKTREEKALQFFMMKFKLEILVKTFIVEQEQKR